MKLWDLGKYKISKIAFKKFSFQKDYFDILLPEAKGNIIHLAFSKNPYLEDMFRVVANTQKPWKTILASFVKNVKIKYAYFKELIQIIFFTKTNV